MAERADKAFAKSSRAARTQRDRRHGIARFQARYRNQNERFITHRDDGMPGGYQSLTTETFARHHQPRNICLQLMNFAHVSGKQS